MSSRLPWLSCLLAVLMMIQPLSAALRDCCCSQRATRMQAPQATKKPIAERASGKCPRCRAMAQAHVNDEDAVAADAIRRSCGCHKDLKTTPLVTRRTVLRLSDESVPLPRWEPLASLKATERTLRLLQFDSVRHFDSGRDLRLRHCSWLT